MEKSFINFKYTTVTTWITKWQNLCGSIFNCSCVDLQLDSWCIHPNWDLKLRNCMNLHFVPADRVVAKDDTWCQTLGQFIYWSSCLFILIFCTFHFSRFFFSILSFLPVNKMFFHMYSATNYLSSALLWYCLVLLKLSNANFTTNATNIYFDLKCRLRQISIPFQHLWEFK